MYEEQSDSLTESQVLQFMNERMREEGMLDRIKIQVRKEVVDQLIKEPRQKKPKRQFDLKVADCFIMNFLQTQNFLCTAEIFIQECGLDKNDILQTQELLQLHGLTIRDYEDHLFSLQQGSISALEIIRSVIKRKYKIEKMDHSCQTDEREETYEQKMKNLERQYLKKIDYSRLNDMQTIEERMNNLKKDIEKKYQAQLVAEIARLREQEIESMRTEEKLRYDKKLKQMRSGIDEEFQDKMKELKKKEDEAITRINAKLKAIEQEKFEKQQEIQKQLEELEQEKIKYHRHKCLDSDVVKQELAEMEAIKQDLRKATEEYKKSKQALDQQNVKQAEMLNEYWKEKIAKEREAKKQEDGGINDDTDWVKYQKDNCKRMQQQREYLLNENETLRQEINDLNYQVKEINKELDKCRNELMQAKDERDVEHNYALRLEGQIRIITQINERKIAI